MTAKLAHCSSLKQKGVILFLLAEDVKPCVILSRMTKQYGSSSISKANYYQWVQAFTNGCKSTTDDSRSGRLEDVSTTETVEAVEDMFRYDKRVTLDEIATNMDLSHSTVYTIVHERLHFLSQLPFDCQNFNK